MSDEPHLRPARAGEAAALEALMKESARELFARVYDERQTQAGVRHIAVLDPVLIDDGTYYAVEAGGAIVACGGWSRRDKLFAGAPDGGEGDARLLDPRAEPARIRAMFVHSGWARRGLGSLILRASEEAARDEGFTQVSLMATLAGLPLYERHGYVGSGQVDIILPDGTNVPGVPMTKPLA